MVAQKYTNRKIDEIYKDHLLRDGLIGPGDECEAKTLIDYTLKKIPECKRLI